MSFELTAHALKIRCRTAAQKLVLMALAHHAQDDGTRVYPGVSALAELAQITERSVQRLLSELVRIGLLEIVEHARGGRGQVTHYAIDVEMVRWLRDSGADLGEICDARVPWPGCRDEPEKPRHDVTLSDAQKGDMVSPFPSKRVTPDAQKGDTGVTPPLTLPPSRINPDPPCARTHAIAREAAAAAAGDDLFEKFRADYPRPSDGEWRVWGDVQLNLWPKLDAGQKRQVVASLPAFVTEIGRRGRKRLCSPATYLRAARWVDYHREAVRPKSEDQVRIPEDAEIWPLLQRIWVEDNPGKARSPRSNGAWFFTRAQVARAYRLREAEAETAEHGVERL